MTAVLLPWLEFAVCAALIGTAGPVLVRNGEAIARLTGLSASWVGLVLLATATSLPELFTGLSAVTVAAAPNIAVGDALGSCVFNLAMLVVLDAMSGKESIYRRIVQGHILAAGFGVVMIGLVGAIILFGRDQLNIRFVHVSLYTPLIFLLYIVAMRATFLFEHRAPPTAPDKPTAPGVTLRRAILRYAGAAVVVAAAGIWLPFAGIEIADAMGWRRTFVGTLLIAGATSLPELVVTVSALRFGAVDMAIANLLGSNLFDVVIIGIDDLAYQEGALLADISPAHAVSAFAAVIMSGLFIVAVLYRPSARIGGAVGWVSIWLLVVYLFSAYAIYLLGH